MTYNVLVSGVQHWISCMRKNKRNLFKSVSEYGLSFCNKETPGISSSKQIIHSPLYCSRSHRQEVQAGFNPRGRPWSQNYSGCGFTISWIVAVCDMFKVGLIKPHFAFWPIGRGKQDWKSSSRLCNGHDSEAVYVTTSHTPLARP